MEIGALSAIRHLGMRIGLVGDGWVERSGGAACRVMIPGGSLLEFDGEGGAVLSSQSGRKLGAGPVDDPAFFASLMHNCDAMMAREYGPGTLESLLLADLLVERSEEAAMAAVWEAVPEGETSGTRPVDHSALLFHPDMKALAESPDPAVRKAYFAWKETRTDTKWAMDWDDAKSLVRWNGAVFRVLNADPALPTANGTWHRVDHLCGRVEAARSLGLVEGRLGDTSRDRQLYALRMVGFATGVEQGEIVAVAVFERGELASVVRHCDERRRPSERINADIVTVIEHVERLQAELDRDADAEFRM